MNITTSIDAPLKLTPQLCRNRAGEARVMKDQMDNGPARAMLEKIAETWDQMAQRLHKAT